MLKYCLHQSSLFYGGNTSKVLAQYKVVLVSEIIIAFQLEVSILQPQHGSYQFLLFVFNVTQISSQVNLGETCMKRRCFSTILVCGFLAVALYLPFEN